MAQLYFKYGAMNSGKSIEILKVKHNYEEQGKKCVLMTSALDTRSGEGKVTSRIGLSQEAIAINDETNIPKEIGMDCLTKGLISCILVDEAQFLSRDQVESLALIVDTMNTPVMCFGLKNTFQNKLFEGTEALLTFADKIEEIKTICWHCSKKATMNIRLHDGKAVTEGATVQIGGEESYRAVCRKHYYELTNKIQYMEE